MGERKGLETNTIHAFVTRRPLGSDSSGRAVTLVGQTAFLGSDGFHGPLAFWDGRFLNVPAAPFGARRQRGRSSLYRAGDDIARLILREVVMHVHGTAQWEAIEPVSPPDPQPARESHGWPRMVMSSSDSHTLSSSTPRIS